MPSDRYKLYLDKGHKVLFNGSWYCYTCGLVGRDLGVARCGHPVVTSNRRKYEGPYVGTPKRRRIGSKQRDPVVGSLGIQDLDVGAILENSGDDVGHHGGVIVGGDGDSHPVSGLDSQGSEECLHRRRRLRSKTRDPSFGEVPLSRGFGVGELSHGGTKRRKLTAESSSLFGGVLVASDSRGGVSGSCQRGSKRTRSEEPITRDSGYNDGLHWPG